MYRLSYAVHRNFSAVANGRVGPFLVHKFLIKNEPRIGRRTIDMEISVKVRVSCILPRCSGSKMRGKMGVV
jgi:hypothetical protein